MSEVITPETRNLVMCYKVEKFVRDGQGIYGGLGPKRFRSVEKAIQYFRAFAQQQSSVLSNGLEIRLTYKSELLAVIGGVLDNPTKFRYHPAYLTHHVASCSKKLKSLYQATKLWNWIDHQENPEPLWGAMRQAAPWAFRDPSDANSIEFTYARPGSRYRTYCVYDTFNSKIISKHRSVVAAIKADKEFKRTISRVHGKSSFIPTDLREVVNGNAIKLAEDSDAMATWLYHPANES